MQLDLCTLKIKYAFYCEIRLSADGGLAATTASTSLHFSVQFAAGYNQRVHAEVESIYKALKKRNKQEANIVHVMSYWTQIWGRP